ncbi:protein NO VEIN domain-containing protein, partial [Streptomyces sp. NPDC056512]|uniref:protein NO VEIN domain-containing protein n=2 Tax=Streptomyces TaxID=1883 RepID=UPI0036B86BA9
SGRVVLFRGASASLAADRRVEETPSAAGHIADPKKRKAIGLQAEDHTVAHYEKAGWTVEKLGKPYDLRCTRGTEERHVEVKGTTGAATSVELTINEALHARDQGRGAPCPQWQKPSRSAQRNRPKHQSHPPLDSRPRHRHRRYAGTDDSHRLIRQRPGRRPPPPRRSRTRPPHDPDVAALVAEGITALEDALRPSHGDAAPQLASTVLGARLRLRAQPPPPRSTDMALISIDRERGQLIVEIQGLDKLWSLKTPFPLVLMAPARRRSWYRRVPAAITWGTSSG